MLYIEIELFKYGDYEPYIIMRRLIDTSMEDFAMFLKTSFGEKATENIGMTSRPDLLRTFDISINKEDFVYVIVYSIPESTKDDIFFDINELIERNK